MHDIDTEFDPNIQQIGSMGVGTEITLRGVTLRHVDDHRIEVANRGPRSSSAEPAAPSSRPVSGSS